MIAKSTQHEETPPKSLKILSKDTMTQKDYLIISEPYPVVCNGKSEDMIHKGLTLRMVAGSGKSLQQENVSSGHLSEFPHQQGCELASRPC